MKKYYKIIKFSDYPEFKPNLTPKDIFTRGSFGGTYWREIYSSITNQSYKNIYKKYKFLKKINPEKMNISYKNYNKNINFYSVKVGTTLRYWETKGWIKKYHPYGWVHWYCDFYIGERSPDDERQIKRWIAIAGKNGRFRKRLINLITSGKDSPAIRQTLQHWAYVHN